MFKDISYLKRGNTIQKHCYNVLNELGIISFLQEYKPVLVGTIPICIDIEGSDADIICHAHNLEEIQHKVRLEYDTKSDFTDLLSENNYIASFVSRGLPIEIYAETKPTDLQNGYQHMLIENRILKLAGETFKEKIIALKKSGYKTEPAFGYLLHLDEPYTELLELSSKTDLELSVIISSVYK